VEPDHRCADPAYARCRDTPNRHGGYVRVDLPGSRRDYAACDRGGISVGLSTYRVKDAAGTLRPTRSLGWTAIWCLATMAASGGGTRTRRAGRFGNATLDR